MGYTQKGPFTNGAAPGIDEDFLNGVEAELLKRDLDGGSEGDLLVKQSDGTWAAGPGVQVAQGSYTGDNTTGRLIPLPFTPLQVVVVKRSANHRYWSTVGSGTRGLWFDGASLSSTTDTRFYPVRVADGFEVNWVTGAGTGPINSSGEVYDYTAIG